MKPAFLAILGLVGVCSAQTADDPPLRLGSVDVSGLIHERFEAWNFFPVAKGQDTYGFSGSMLRLNFSQQSAGFYLGR